MSTELRTPLRTKMRRMLDASADLLLPQRCVVCDRFGAALHDSCLAELPRASGPRCERCWRPGSGTWCERCADEGPETPAFAGLRAAYRFDEHARLAILEAKFRGTRQLLTPLAVAAAETVPAAWRADLVTSIPLTGRRRRERGFNQAQVAAGHVARALGLPEAELLRRTEERRPQASLSAEERARNLDGAFAPHSGAAIEGRRILVVDDVTTTGATFDAAASALLAAGAEAAYALALARED